jgi:diguanylate cyclase (GGDEF)-like protein/PAS domain S-box-containing protein
MRFLPGKATLAVLMVVGLAVGAGSVGVSRLLAVARDHYDLADTAADLKFDLSELSALSDEYTLSPGSSDLGQQLADSEARVAADVSTVERSGIEPSDMVATVAQVRSYVALVEQRRQSAERGDAESAPAQGAAIDAAFNGLAVGVDTELDESRGSAARSIHEVELLGFGLGGLVLAAVGGAVWWDGRRRRGIARDRAERSNRARFEAMVEHGSDLLAVTYDSGADTYVSPSIEHLLGYRSDSWAAGHLDEIVDPAEQAMVAGLLAQAKATGRAGPADCRVRHADGSSRIMEIAMVDMTGVAEVAGMLWSARDVTDRRALELQLERSAFSDSLTGLPNRALLRQRLDHAAARDVRGGHPIAVLLADLDGFKAVNDSLGHDAGDAVLVETAARLAGCVRPGDTVARLGGDEFAIILEDVREPGLAERLADRMLEIMRQPFAVAGTDLHVGVSIGIALPGVDTGTDLLRNADTAMYNAKALGRGQWTVFEPVMHQVVQDRLQLSADLDGALEQRQLEVHYQPTLSIATGQILGTEALLRWHHPLHGLLPPAEFIPLAEETGLIVPIGRWVLEQACRQTHAWHQQFPDQTPLTISINLSGHQLAHDQLVADVKAVLDSTGIDPDTVVLELTETVLMNDVDIVKTKLAELKNLGVRIAIDDFGTGYSSLAYLQQFPVDILKIDRAFVEAASTDTAGGQALVKAIIDLGASLDLATIAEGIETQDQADLMLTLGCPTGQGFLYARPAPPDHLQTLLTANTPRTLEPVT